MECHARILVVDDEADTCANLSDIFTDLGYQVDVAYDGLSALELVRGNAYDVAILDLKMPGMDGLELYRHIRELSSDTVAIIVTAYASGETAQRSLEAGAWQILSKPVNFEKLLQLVAQASGQPCILLVDDDRDLCGSLWDVFRDAGYRVACIYDVSEAREAVHRKSFDVAIVDLRLPDGSGREVIAELKEVTPDVHTILITGFRDEAEQLVDDAVDRGADAVCYKPFDVAGLLNTVAQLTKKSHKRQKHHC